MADIDCVSIQGGLHDYARPRIRNRSAIMVAAAVGFGLLVLVAAAFSVAAESRVVANRSAQLHLYDEILRSSLSIRAQLASAVNFSQIDELLESDSSEAVNRNLRDTETSLADLDIVRPQLADDDPGVAELDQLIIDGNNVLGLLRGGDTQGARTALIDELDPTYEQVIAVVVTERERLAESLLEADKSLGQLGALATFIIAFFVPTVAIFVYRQITRRQRETVELAQLLSDARSMSAWRARLIQQSGALAEAELDTLPESPLTSKLRSRLTDLEFLVSATTTGHGYVFEGFPIGDLRTQVQAEWPGLVSLAGGADGTVWADREAVALLLHDLVRNAKGRGADRVLMAGGSDTEDLWVALTDNGSQLSQAGVSGILDASSLAETSGHKLDPDSALVLILGRFIAPALGGRFWCDNVGANTRFTLRLPLASAKSKRPVSPTVAAGAG